MGDISALQVKKMHTMQSKIVFLGTGAGKYVLGKQLRFTGGIIVESAGVRLHIDPGPGTLNTLKACSFNPREHTAILVSQNHIGHCNDVNALVDAITAGGIDRQSVLIGPNSLINGDEHNIPYLTKFHRDCLEKVMVVRKGQRVGINDIEIDALPAHHTDDSCGFKIQSPDFTLAYTGDTSFTPGLYEHYKGADIIIFNVMYPGDKKPKDAKQLSSADVIKILKNIKPSLSIITHFGYEMLEADPLYEAREIQKATGCQTIAAKDGMAINPSSYSAKAKQKSLKYY